MGFNSLSLYYTKVGEDEQGRATAGEQGFFTSNRGRAEAKKMNRERHEAVYVFCA